MPIDLYATDGKCHNANAGTYGHECRKPAEWIGHKADGFASGFCSRCKAEGDEARPIVRWEPIAPKATRKRHQIARQSKVPDAVMSAMETETDPLPDAVAAAWDTELFPPKDE